MITTTINRCKNKGAPRDLISKYKRAVGRKWPARRDTPLTWLLDTIGIDHVLWILWHVETGHSDLCVKFAIDTAKRGASIFQLQYPDDDYFQTVITAAEASVHIEDRDTPKYEGNAKAAMQVAHLAHLAAVLDPGIAAAYAVDCRHHAMKCRHTPYENHAQRACLMRLLK